MSSGLREFSMATADRNGHDGRFSRTVVSLSTVFTRLGALLFTGLHFYDLVAVGAYSKLAVIVVIVVPSMAIAAWLLVRPRPAWCTFWARRFKKISDTGNQTPLVMTRHSLVPSIRVLPASAPPHAATRSKIPRSDENDWPTPAIPATAPSGRLLPEVPPDRAGRPVL